MNISIGKSSALSPLGLTTCGNLPTLALIAAIGIACLGIGASPSIAFADTGDHAFWVNKNGNAQTVSTGVTTLLTWSTEIFDTDNEFASNRFTPQKAGYYQVNLATQCSTVPLNGFCQAILYKNGSIEVLNSVNSPVLNDEVFTEVSSVIFMNGSTDYIEGYVYSDSATISGSIPSVFFNGKLILGSENSDSEAILTLNETIVYLFGIILFTVGASMARYSV